MVIGTNNTTGFTMIELIIYIAIISMIVVGFVSFSVSISDSRSKAYVVSEVQANLRDVYTFISHKTRSASDVVTPTIGNASTTLELDMPGANPNLTFQVIDNILTVTEGAGSPVAITSDEVRVTQMDFTNYASSTKRDNLKIEMTIEYNSDSGDPIFSFEKSLETTVRLRK